VSSAQTPPGKLPSTLEILSWNIQKTRKSGWQADLARLGTDLDLVFIQEADPDAALHKQLPSTRHQTFAEGYNRTGVMTLSAGAPGWHCTLSIREPWLGSQKATNVTSYQLDLRSTAFGRALDHVYVRGLQAKSAEVIPVQSSDHNPLRVRLALL